MANPNGPMNLDAVVAQVKRLINAQLKQVCKGAGLPVSGAKAALQSRIIDQLQSYARSANYDEFNRLKSLVQNPDHDFTGYPPSRSSARPLSNNPMQPQNQYQNSFAASPSKPAHIMSPKSNTPGPSKSILKSGLNTFCADWHLGAPLFKPSPFYSIVEPLTPVLECKVREATRDTVQATINLRPAIADEMNKSTTLRAMIYCAADSGVSPFSKVDIAFPYQVEIKVNQDEVKSNLRGLKNKPGSTRPADITNLLRKRAGYQNIMEVLYALTQKRFFLIVNLVRQHPVEELVAKLMSGKTISSERVVREMISKAQDSEIVATSSIMSLKCPLSTLRIDVPCRSTVCTHNQCFDATSFLQLQEQAPTWTCPVCNKSVTFENLHVDQYVDDILRSSPTSVEQVVIEPNGRWSMNSGANTSPRPSAGRATSDDEAELVEIQEPPRVSSIKLEGSYEQGMLTTPPISSREPSTSSALHVSANNKRSASQVVDLTLSSDEDEEPIRAHKRQNTSPSSTGLQGVPNTHKEPIRSPIFTQERPHQQQFTANPFPMSNGYPPPRAYGQHI